MKEVKQIVHGHRDLPEHAHLSGSERRGNSDHLTARESSPHRLGHANLAYPAGPSHNRLHGSVSQIMVLAIVIMFVAPVTG